MAQETPRENPRECFDFGQAVFGFMANHCEAKAAEDVQKLVERLDTLEEKCRRMELDTMSLGRDLIFCRDRLDVSETQRKALEDTVRKLGSELREVEPKTRDVLESTLTTYSTKAHVDGRILAERKQLREEALITTQEHRQELQQLQGGLFTIREKLDRLGGELKPVIADKERRLATVEKQLQEGSSRAERESSRLDRLEDGVKQTHQDAAEQNQMVGELDKSVRLYAEETDRQFVTSRQTLQEVRTEIQVLKTTSPVLESNTQIEKHQHALRKAKNELQQLKDRRSADEQARREAETRMQQLEDDALANRQRLMEAEKETLHMKERACRAESALSKAEEKVRADEQALEEAVKRFQSLSDKRDAHEKPSPDVIERCSQWAQATSQAISEAAEVREQKAKQHAYTIEDENSQTKRTRGGPAKAYSKVDPIMTAAAPQAEQAEERPGVNPKAKFMLKPNAEPQFAASQMAKLRAPARTLAPCQGKSNLKRRTLHGDEGDKPAAANTTVRGTKPSKKDDSDGGYQPTPKRPRPPRPLKQPQKAPGLDAAGIYAKHAEEHKRHKGSEYLFVRRFLGEMAASPRVSQADRLALEDRLIADYPDKVRRVEQLHGPHRGTGRIRLKSITWDEVVGSVGRLLASGVGWGLRAGG